MLPHDLPNWKTCYHYFWVWSRDGTWEMINVYFVKKLRHQVYGRKLRPSAAIIDSQVCKSSSWTHGHRGRDGGKKMTGRKCFILTDTEGLLLAVWICAASVSEKQGTMQLLRAIRMNPRVSMLLAAIKAILADQGYQGPDLKKYFARVMNWTLKIIRRPKGTKGFVVLAKRWIVERTFAWMSHSRRLSRDYEKSRHSAQAMLYLAMLPIMLRKLDK